MRHLIRTILLSPCFDLLVCKPALAGLQMRERFLGSTCTQLGKGRKDAIVGRVGCDRSTYYRFVHGDVWLITAEKLFAFELAEVE
jgi:hypothetical protein